MQLSPPKWNTFVIPVLVSGMIDYCLETLYRFTEPSSFYVFIIDQTIDGLDANKLRDTYKNLMVIRSPKTDVHSTGNLGHSQASNLGIKLVETPYVTFLNDDVFFINKAWWQGVLDTFEQVEKATPDRPAIMVNPASIKLPDWSVGRKHGDDFYIMPEKKEYSEADWRFLIDEPHYVNKHLTIQPGSVIDGINLYCTVADTKKLIEIGMVDDFWYPGNANDYDISCRAGMFGYRCVGTTLSWVFHHWSVTFHSEEEKAKLLQPELMKGDLRDKWGERLDIWGTRCPVCLEDKVETIMRTKDGVTAVCPIHPGEIYDIPQNTFVPL